MKLIGLIGGISWVSTADYYRLINEGINKQLGGLNFARCIIYSFNYADIVQNNNKDDWDANYRLMYEASAKLINSGAEAIAMCVNTMHLLADRLQGAITVPLINIATVTAKEVKQQQINKVALLGTRFTMERDFFRDKLTEQGIEVMIPEEEDRKFIHATVFDELGKGILKPATKARYISIIEGLAAQGVQGAILGCTEIPMLIKQEDVRIPVFDTTAIHADAIVEFALQ
jgi:aspartate racemase